MNADEHGDMGFMESMVAVMAVVTVLTAFIGLVAGVAVTESDPTENLDPGMFTGTIDGGVFHPSYQEYLESYVAAYGLEGASVTVTVPGGFCDAPDTTVVGNTDGDPWSRTFTSTVPVTDGRSVIAVFEVVLCVRTGTASSP